MHIFLAIIAAGIVLHFLREGLDEHRQTRRDARLLQETGDPFINPLD